MTRTISVTQNVLDLRSALGWPVDDIEMDGFLYDLGYVAQELEDRIYEEFGERSLDAGFVLPIDPTLASIIRKCIGDYPQTYASEKLSFFLLRGGYSDDLVVGALDKWSRLTFDWKARNITVGRIESLLADAGLPRKIPEELASLLASWIVNPLTQFSEYWDVKILKALLGDRAVHTSLDSDYIDRDARFFSSLFTGLDLRSEVENVDQYCCPDWGTAPAPVFLQEYMDQNFPDWDCCVHFSYRGASYAFPVVHGSRLKDDQVLANFDAFMEKLGRPERAFRIDYDRENWQDAGAYVVGTPQALPRAFQELGILLLSASPSAHTTIDFGLGAEPFIYSGVPQIARVG